MKILKNPRHRLRIVWRALTREDVILIAFHRGVTEGEVIAATDRTEIDELAKTVFSIFFTHTVQSA